MSPITKSCDYLVIGGGSGGLASARRASRVYKASTVLVEAKKLGGTCVNVGCIPKKIMWNAANVQGALRDAKHYGFNVEEKAPLAWDQLADRRTAFVEKLNTIHETNLVVDSVEYLNGTAAFVNSGKVEVTVSDGTTVQLNAKNILIAVGGRPHVPDIPGSDLGITSDGFFALRERPKKMAIIGAGYIAVELAGMVHALGVTTHMFCRHDNFLRTFDSMIQDQIMTEYESQGIHMHKSTSVVKVEKLDNGWKRLHYTQSSGNSSSSKTEDFDCVLWAIGRTPNIEHLNLGVTNLDLDKSNHIKVDKYQNTNIDHIKSIGDVSNSGFELTPVAIAAGRRLADRLFGGQEDAHLEYENIPSVIFAHPEAGSIGLSEALAREKYGEDNIRVYKTSFTPLHYAVFDSDAHRSKTMYKLVCHGREEKVVGLHVVGMDSSELLQGFGVAIKMGATKKDFDRCVPIHPTSAEELVTLT